MSDCVHGIILAAGLSTRMGKPKLMLEIDGIPIVARVMRAALDSRLHRVVLVCGHDAKDVEQILGDLCFHARLSRTINHHPELGMSSSLCIGMGKIPREALGAMIILADQPWLSSENIDRLLDVFREDSERIVVPAVKGRKTTPVIFPRRFFRELSQVTGDIGGRGVLTQHRKSVVLVEMGALYDDSDMDTAEDYRKLKK